MNAAYSAESKSKITSSIIAVSTLALKTEKKDVAITSSQGSNLIVHDSAKETIMSDTFNIISADGPSSADHVTTSIFASPSARPLLATSSVAQQPETRPTDTDTGLASIYSSYTKQPSSSRMPLLSEKHYATSTSLVSVLETKATALKDKQTTQSASYAKRTVILPSSKDDEAISPTETVIRNTGLAVTPPMLRARSITTDSIISSPSGRSTTIRFLKLYTSNGLETTGSPLSRYSSFAVGEQGQKLTDTTLSSSIAVVEDSPSGLPNDSHVSTKITSQSLKYTYSSRPVVHTFKPILTAVTKSTMDMDVLTPVVEHTPGPSGESNTIKEGKPTKSSIHFTSL